MFLLRHRHPRSHQTERELLRWPHLGGRRLRFGFAVKPEINAKLYCCYYYNYSEDHAWLGDYNNKSLTLSGIIFTSAQRFDKVPCKLCVSTGRMWPLFPPFMLGSDRLPCAMQGLVGLEYKISINTTGLATTTHENAWVEINSSYLVNREHIFSSPPQQEWP